MAERQAARRELIDTDRRYVRRNTKGQFKEIEAIPGAVAAAAVVAISGSVSLKDIARAPEAERELILRMVTRTRWNRKEAAAILGTDYKALRSKINERGLD